MALAEEAEEGSPWLLGAAQLKLHVRQRHRIPYNVGTPEKPAFLITRRRTYEEERECSLRHQELG
jgi:hypothetical protein